MAHFFWFSKEKLQGISIKNFGDDLNPLLLQHITKKEIIWRNPAEQNWYERNFTRINFAIGSIIHFATDNCNIWGSGLIDSKSKFPKKAKYSAVRGPLTFRILKENGCKVNPIFGDPALLLPRFFQGAETKKYKLGIIPHYVEVDEFLQTYGEISDEIKVIDLRGNVMEVLNEITSCEKIISSSLHGIIVGMSYGIPSLRMKLSEKIYGDGIKYEDYYQSVGINEHETIPICRREDILSSLKLFNSREYSTLVQYDLVKVQDSLLSVKPF